MAIIWVLTKQGKILKTKIVESVGTIWNKMNGGYDPNIPYNYANKDFILLTSAKGKSLIFNKRYLYKITE